MVGTFVRTVSWTVGMAMGALVGGAIPFDVALKGAAMAFIAFVVGTGSVFGIPDAGGLVVVW